MIAPELVPYAEFPDLSRHYAFNYLIFNAVVTSHSKIILKPSAYGSHKRKIRTAVIRTVSATDRPVAWAHYKHSLCRYQQALEHCPRVVC